MGENTEVEILIKYTMTKDPKNVIKYSFIVDKDYETALRKFINIKGGKGKVSIISIQDWDRATLKYTIAEPITIEDKESIVYQIMNE